MYVRRRTSLLATGVGLSTVLLCLGACRKPTGTRAADPEQAAVQQAIAAADQFHKELAAGRTAEICRDAQPEAFGGAGSGGCEQYLQRVREKLGDFVSAQRRQLPIASTRPARVGMEYEATFHNGPAREHFEFLFQNSRPQLTSYRVASELIP